MELLLNTLQQGGLTPNQAQRLAGIFSGPVDLKKHQFLLKEQQICNKLVFLTEGMCRYYYTTDNGDEVTRWVALEGEFVVSFGSFIHQNPTLENIQTIKPSKMLLASRADFYHLYHTEPFVKEFWIRSIEHYLVGIEARVYSLIALSAQKRFEQLKQQFPQLVNNVPDKYLAAILGIKPRHLTRLRAGNL
jgi:CRP/FNR family transcriptional regulator, anaerobic regulatory protein